MKTSCIVSPAKDPFIIVRKSWIEICDGNHCAAMLLNFLVSWHDWKIEQQPRAMRENQVAELHGDAGTQNTSLIQHHTIGELRDGLLGMYSKDAIAKGLRILIAKNFISQQRNPNPRYKFDQTRHYLVFSASIQAAIDNEISQSRKIDNASAESSQSNIDLSPMDEREYDDVQLKSATDERFLANHYQDPYQNTNQDTPQNTHPERAREAAPVVEKISEPTPDNTPASQSSIEPTPDLLEQHSISRVGESSAACSMNLHGSTKQFNDSWNYSSDIAPITDELIRLYNIGKPDNWTGIAGDSRRARRKIQDMAFKYQGTGGKLDELPGLMQNALLFYRSSDFHTKKEFGSGDIFWLCEQDRVEIAAAKWAGSGESAKRKVATAILERENGIKHWQDGHVMSSTELVIKARSIPKMLLHHPDLPPYSWVEKNMPEILNKLDPNYPKEELNYACN
ncbi:MAG: hypothetical protein ACRCZS_02445 [Chroococcidiopsis sp.]